ncbi:hydrogenase expression/formation C-terminal domain-containing protein [Methylacidimicrobium cyclopophantes]|nr:hydrogenase expression/formation C-terminal domain-containing protein [Methylacidimicrobium cyclopophantes]
MSAPKEMPSAAKVEKGSFPFSVEKAKKAKRRVTLSLTDGPLLSYAPRIEETLLALERMLVAQRVWEKPSSLPLSGLEPEELELLLGILGEGTAIVEDQGEREQTAIATMLSGVWFTERKRAPDRLDHEVDVGILPSFAAQRLALLPSLATGLPLPPSSVAGAALLQELASKQKSWEQEGLPGEINLLLHPLLPVDEQWLGQFLGPAPLVVWLDGRCRWWLSATQWRDIWRMEVRNGEGKPIASLLEIGRYPGLIALPPAAFTVGARRVRRLLQLYGE